MKNSKVIRAGVGYTIGNYLLKGLNFFTIPIFAYLLTPSDYGKYNIFISYENILFIILGIGIHTSYKSARYKYKYVYENAEKGKDYKTYVSTTMLMLLVNSLICIIICNIFTNTIQKYIGLDRISINLLILQSLSTALFQCFNADIALEYKFKNFLRVSALNAIGNICLSIILICFVFTDNKYMGRILGTTIPMTFLAVCIVVRYFYISRPKNAKYFLKWGIKYSVPIVPHGIGQVILSQFDRIMIERLVSASASGIYSFAYNINIILNVTTQSLDNVWNPWFFEKMHKKEYDDIKEISSVYITGMSFFVGMLLMVSPELVLLLGSKKYEDAIYCVIPIVVSGYFAFLYTIPSGVEYFYEKTKYIAIGTIGAAVLNIILNTIYIYKFGYIAAAYTTLFTYMLYFVFHYLLSMHMHGSALFSNKVVIGNVVTVLLYMVVAIICLNNILIRWFIACGLGIILIVISEKKFGILKKIYRKER